MWKYLKYHVEKASFMRLGEEGEHMSHMDSTIRLVDYLRKHKVAVPGRHFSPVPLSKKWLTHLSEQDRFDIVQILKREKLFISLAKTVFATVWLRFLGYIIGHTATFADPKKVAVIKDILPCSKTNPWSKTAVKSFAGMTE
jgi:hypothetical protein